MKENFDLAMKKLRKYFDKDPEDDGDACMDLEILAEVYRRVTATIHLNPDRNVAPPIELKDVS